MAGDFDEKQKQENNDVTSLFIILDIICAASDLHPLTACYYPLVNLVVSVNSVHASVHSSWFSFEAFILSGV